MRLHEPYDTSRRDGARVGADSPGGSCLHTARQGGPLSLAWHKACGLRYGRRGAGYFSPASAGDPTPARTEDHRMVSTAARWSSRCEDHRTRLIPEEEEAASALVLCQEANCVAVHDDIGWPFEEA
ncbi:hypothetical protein GCM10011578_087800 [Streptomyces fuscichromogenes]|uniref:Uncharacterized protein n=1 Tax=Streptomyces fuscichromogenes TaxID=1324013 RepID=A0A917XMD9_9ACTN|nr:hypothetical protein GCM10011578_087800 [Streptomyces fuscichromogenes]